ncbi:MAG: hypothetical protein O3A36_03260, partial [bacterium]|nr:hypothetical protein [bacterium]
MIKPITYISASIGIILLLINIAGFFLPLRNPKITQVTAGFPQHRAIVTYQEARDILVRSPQSADEYINRVTNTVNQAMLHYWDAEKANTYHIRVPIYENYLIWAGKFIAPSIYKMYEYCDAEKALERGIGLCSQHAIITTEIFRKNGLDAHIVGLNGHVVTTVRADTINDSWHISDADNGVVIPHSLEEIERNP